MCAKIAASSFLQATSTDSRLFGLNSPQKAGNLATAFKKPL
jgi:hypothetical protein